MCSRKVARIGFGSPRVGVEVYAVTPARPNFWALILGLCGAMHTLSQGCSVAGSAARAASSRDRHRRLAPTVSSEVVPISVSVAELAERLRMMEETNKKLARNWRGRGESIKSRWSRSSRGSRTCRRSSDRRTGPGTGEVGGGLSRGTTHRRPTPNPRARLHRGSVRPYLPRRDTRSRTSPRRRLPLTGSFGPGFEFRPRTRSSGSGSTTSPRSRGGSGVRPTRSRPTAGSSCPASGSSSTATSPSRSSTSSRSTGGRWQSQPAERLHQHPFQRPVRAPLWPLLHTVALRPVRDLELLAADARAVDVHDQRRPQPPVRHDGLGLPLRQAARLRGRGLQRLAQLVREPHERVDFVGYLNAQAVPAVGIAAVRPVLEPRHFGRVRPPGPGARARFVPHRRRLTECRHPRVPARCRS